MTVTVLDSTNLNAIIENATGEPIEEAKQEGDVKSEEGKKTEGETQEKAETKDEEKTDEKKEAKTAEKKEDDDADDVEGEDGFTPRQKREYTQSMLKTIGKKHRLMKEAEEFAAAQYNERKLAEQRALDLEKQLQSTQGQQADQQAKEAAKPKISDYQTQEEYFDALTDWKVDEKIRVRDAQRAHEAMISTAKQRISKAIELVPDYREVIDSTNIELSPVVASYMQKSPMLAELSYHLGQNHDVLLSLKDMAADEQLVAIGKIEAKLKPFSESKTDSSDGIKPSNTEAHKTASETITGKLPSKARNTAPVIQPLSTTGTVEKDVAAMNIRETIADWQKRQGANLGLRKRH